MWDWRSLKDDTPACSFKVPCRHPVSTKGRFQTTLKESYRSLVDTRQVTECSEHLEEAACRHIANRIEQQPEEGQAKIVVITKYGKKYGAEKYFLIQSQWFFHTLWQNARLPIYQKHRGRALVHGRTAELSKHWMCECLCACCLLLQRTWILLHFALTSEAVWQMTPKKSSRKRTD